MINVDICHITKVDVHDNVYEYCTITVGNVEYILDDDIYLVNFKLRLDKLKIPFDEWDTYIKTDEDYDGQ